ncbi:hypothetical protein GJAV_G00146940 [Gymnothorax javanicus]|nr:hypothetical protein GJAV_G00146940 [Gymnothorax javanicus]
MADLDQFLAQVRVMDAWMCVHCACMRTCRSAACCVSGSNTPSHCVTNWKPKTMVSGPKTPSNRPMAV